MKESLLWKHLKPELKRHGKFQKVSDRFTPGVPDVLGVGGGLPLALELKELKGVRILKTSFRPGQLDWLRDWKEGGGVSWILSTWRSRVLVHPWTCGELLEKGSDPEEVLALAELTFQRDRSNTWESFASSLMELSSRSYGTKKRVVRRGTTE